MNLGDQVVIGSDAHGLHGSIVAIVHQDEFQPGFDGWGAPESKDLYPSGVLVDTVEAGLVLYPNDQLNSFRKLL
jgi:hypothetical protein